MRAAGGHADLLPLRSLPRLLGGSQVLSEGEGPQAPSPSILWSSRGLPGSWLLLKAELSLQACRLLHARDAEGVCSAPC